jgi:hypothetical protein
VGEKTPSGIQLFLRLSSSPVSSSAQQLGDSTNSISPLDFASRLPGKYLYRQSGVFMSGGAAQTVQAV